MITHALIRFMQFVVHEKKVFHSILFISHSYTMSSGVGQLRSPIHTKRKKFVRGHQNTIHVQFGFNEVSSF